MIVLTLALAGCHLVFPHTPRDRGDGPGDTSTSDTRTNDTRASDLPRGDAPRDGQPFLRDTSAKDDKPLTKDASAKDKLLTTDVSTKDSKPPPKEASTKKDSEPADLPPKPLEAAANLCESWKSWSAFTCTGTHSCCMQCTGQATYQILCTSSWPQTCTCLIDGAPTICTAAYTCEQVLQQGCCGF